MNQRRGILAQINAYSANYQHMQEFEQKANVQLDRPVPDEMLGMSPSEIDIEMQMNPHDLASLEIKDYLTASLGLNDWNMKADNICGDLSDLGLGVAHVYIDEVGVIKVDRWLPERVVANRCVEKDFSDMVRVGVFQEITVAELKVRTKGKIGTKGEEDYRQIASKIAEGGANKYRSDGGLYDDTRYSYKYDHEKVTVFTCYWYSVDSYTYKTFENEAGNKRTKKMDYGYVPFKGDPNVNAGQGMTDEQFNTMNNGAEMIYRNEIRNVYKCSWVVDTDYVYEFGLMTNMPRYAKSLAETKLPVIIYSLDFMSPIGNVENALDMFQLEWLQFQAHTAASKPPGIMIERNALIKAGSKPGQGGKSTDWKKLLQLYSETGSIVFDGYDIHGAPLPWFPVQEIRNGLSPGALEHFNMMISILDLIRSMLAINDLVAGDNPQERLGKGVAQLSFGAADLNISHMHRAFKSIYERVCKMIVDLIPDAFDRGVLPGFVEMLGMESLQFFNLTRDLNLRDMGIIIEEGPDDIVKERISQAILIAIDRQELDPEDAVYVELEDNPYRAIQILKRKRKEKLRMAQEMSAQNVQQQSQAIQQEQATSSKLAIQQRKSEAEIEEDQILLQDGLERQRAKEEFLQEMLLEKMRNKHELTAQEKAFMHDKALAILNERTVLRKQRLANQKPKPRTSSTSKR